MRSRTTTEPAWPASSGPGPVGGAGGIRNLTPAGERIWRDHVGVGRTHSHMAFSVFGGREGLFAGHRILPSNRMAGTEPGDLLEEAGAPPLGL